MATVKLNPATGKISGGPHSDMPLVIIPNEITNLGALTQAEADSCRIYSDSSLTTELAREVVSADEIHVKVSSVTSSTEIWFDYDGVRSDYGATDTYGRNAVWGDYAFVSHDGGGTDSTGNYTPSANGGVNAGGTTGQVGDATDYDGTDDYIQITGYKGILGTNAGTFTTTFSTTKTVDELSPLVQWGDDGGSAGQALFLSIENGVIYIRTLGGRVASYGSGYNDGSFYKIDVTYPSNPDLSDVKIYIDGLEVTRASISNDGAINIQSGNDVLFASGFNTGVGVSYHFDVTEDENRFYQGQKTSTWITTEYNNQSDNGAFWEATAVSTFNSAIARRRILLGM